MTTKPNSLVSKTGPCSFGSLGPEANAEDYRARGNSSTSLVTSRTHIQPKNKDLANEDAKDEGRSGRQGERRVLQHHLASDPDEAGVEGEGDGRHPYTHDLRL
jgi:hypothetical protein